MAPRRAAPAWAAASALLIAATLAACVPEPGESPGSGAIGTAEASPSAASTPSPAATGDAAAIPTDCRAILTPGVLDELAGIPLNDPAAGIPTGAQPDGSLACLWRDPSVDTTNLLTTIAYMSRGPALDVLNSLLAQGYACYTPDGGTRCEKTWFSEPDLLPQGRTLFWRDDIMIDTTFSNLAPSGYTAAIVASLYG